MQSEPNSQQIDPGEVGIAPENEELGHVYKQVVREVLARIDQRLAELERSTAPDPSQAQRARSRSLAWVGERIMFRSWAKRGLLGLLLSAGVVGAALAWQSLDRDTMKSVAARVTPQFVLNLVSAKDSQDAAAPEAPSQDAATQEAAPTANMSAATDAAPAAPPPTTIDADGRNSSASAAASLSAASDQSALIQKMARDIEGLTQGMEQLKTSQDQMSRDNARAAEQFRASEDQLIRTILRMSDQTTQPKNPQARTPQDRNAQAKNGAAPPRTTGTSPRSRLPSFLSRGAT
jgi:hypothetical protein